MSFKWDPVAAALAGQRFSELAGDANHLEPLVDNHVRAWPGGGGLLDLMVPNHRKLANELWISSWCTPDMLEAITANLTSVGAAYQAADDASRVNIEHIWQDFDFDTSRSGDGNLERHGKDGYDFGSDFPPHRPVTPGDYSLSDIVNKILGFPDSMLDMYKKEPAHPVLKVIWREVLVRWDDLAKQLAECLTGDWDGAYEAGDAMVSVGMYWRDLAWITRSAAGTLFRHWDGDASEHAERYVSLVSDLYGEAAESIFYCGDDYRHHAHGCYLLFKKLHDELTTVPVELSNLFAVLDRQQPLETIMLQAVLNAAYKFIGIIFRKFVRIVEIVRLVLHVIEAVVALLLSAYTVFTSYSNRMRGFVEG